MLTPSAISNPVDLNFSPVDNLRLANLCGPLDGHLRQIEASLGVTVSRRGENFRIDGRAAATATAEKVIATLYQSATRELTSEDVQLNLIEVSSAQTSEAEN